MKKIAATIAAVVLLSGCGVFEETYLPEEYVDSSENTQSSPTEPASTEPSPTAASSISAVSLSQTAPSSKAREPIPEESGTRELITTPAASENKLAFTIENLFSEGAYYTLVISGAKTDTEGNGSVKVNGEYYNDIALTLYKNGRQTDRLTMDVPRGERFIILESAAEELSYGCEVISNLREYSAGEYPDYIELVFRGGSSEAAVPEYARFFTVFEGSIAELPVYENGVKTEPRGAKLEPRGAGLAAQYLTVLKPNAVEDYEIIKYEYRFDLENKRLNKKQVRFYGYAY